MLEKYIISIDGSTSLEMRGLIIEFYSAEQHLRGIRIFTDKIREVFSSCFFSCFLEIHQAVYKDFK